MPLSARLRTTSFLTVSAATLFGAGWFTARRMPPASAQIPGTGQPVAVPGAVVVLPEGVAAPALSGKPSTAPSKLPDSAVKLLGTLDGSGSLKNQAAILRYASTLDAASARAAALSFVGKGYSQDKNSNALSAAVFTRWAELDPEGVVQSARTSGDRNFRWRALSAGMEAMAQKSPARAWEAASGMGIMKTEAQRAVIFSLSASNPQGAFELASQVKGYYGNWAVGNVMSAWAEKDPAGASAAALSLPTGQMRNNALNSVAARWGATDFEGASAWAASLGRPSERVAAMGSAVSSLCQVDPERSLSLLDSTDVGGRRNQIVNQAMSAIALKDFDGAVGRISSFKNFMDKSSALSALAGAASDENRAKLLAMAATLPANLARSIYEGGVWRGMESDPEAAVESIEKIPIASVREQSLMQAVEGLGYAQPEKAAALFGKLQSVSQNPELASNLASTMAWSDPEKAVKWANQLGTEALKRSALVASINTWAQSDPAMAAQEITKITNPDTRAEVTRAVAESLAGRSLGEAEKWANSLSGPDQSAALGKVVEQAATQAPDRVESLYAGFISRLSVAEAEKSENQGIARTVATQLAQNDAGKAAAWSLSLPEGGARDQAVSGVVSTWAAYDAVAASQWVQNLPEGKGRDLATGNLVNTIARDDPESAWAWATSISDDSRRREAAAAALAGWKANGNQEAAKAALNAAGFNESDHKELLRKLE